MKLFPTILLAVSLSAIPTLTPRLGAAATHDHPGAASARADSGDPHSGHALAGAPSSHDPDSGADMIGRAAPPWTFDRWLRTRPLSLAGLRGKVVLLRWWTEGCHYCAATLPELERVRLEDAAKGLVVIGVFHPKPPRDEDPRHILAVANQLGFSGPIAVDGRWTTLARYWLAGHPDRNFTSVSFLIDRAGLVRWVHGGGEYHPSDDPRHAQCAIEYRDFQRTLDTLLDEGVSQAASKR